MGMQPPQYYLCFSLSAILAIKTKSSPAKRKLPYDSNFQYTEAGASKKQHFQSSNMFPDVSMTNGDTHGLKLSHESNNCIHGSNLSSNVHCPSGTFSVVHSESSDTLPHLRTTTSKLPSDVAYLKRYPVGYEHEYTDTDNTPQSVNIGFNSNVKNNGINMSTPTLFDITNSSATHLACSSCVRLCNRLQPEPIELQYMNAQPSAVSNSKNS
ncbi:hypothetical protein Tco_0038145 [Tanacetum coccineum]